MADVANNLHCAVRIGSGYSYDFSLVDSSSHTVTLGADIATGNFIYHCDGAKSPSLSSTTAMTMVWNSAANVLIGDIIVDN